MYSLFTSSDCSTLQNAEKAMGKRCSNMVPSKRTSNSPSRWMQSNPDATSAQSKPKMSGCKSSSRLHLQSKLNSARDSKKAVDEFYKKVNFKPEFYGLNVYWPGMNTKFLETFFSNKGFKQNQHLQQSPHKDTYFSSGGLTEQNSNKRLSNEVRLIKAIGDTLGKSSRRSISRNKETFFTSPERGHQGNMSHRQRFSTRVPGSSRELNHRFSSTSTHFKINPKGAKTRNSHRAIFTQTGTKIMSSTITRGFYTDNKHQQSGSIEPEMRVAKKNPSTPAKFAQLAKDPSCDSRMPSIERRAVKPLESGGGQSPYK